MTSWLKNVPASSAASSFAERPSTMKELARFRWEETEMPVPGTAEVSAKRWLAPVFVRDTPGTSRARSRKFRPFSGRSWTSSGETAEATCVRTVSTTSASAMTEIASSKAGFRATGTSSAVPTVSRSRRCHGAEPAAATSSW